MKKSLKIALCAAMLCGAVALSVWANSITAVSMSIGMPNQTVQLAGNPTGSVVNVTSDVCTGDDLSFDVTFGTDTQGNSTTFPVNGVPFTVAKTAGPGTVTLSPTSFNVDFGVGGVSSPLSKAITMTAPSTASVAGDAYTVKVDSQGKTTGSGSNQNKLGGGKLIINFTVKDCTQPCVPATTSIVVGTFCVLLHQTDTIDLTATLISGASPGTPVAGQILHFSVDGTAVGNATTNASGVATISNFDVSGLSVGNHAILAEYDGVNCATNPAAAYAPSSSQGSISVKYGAVTFQQPINADGSSIFKGGVIPVKIKVYDANMAIVSDAQARVYFDYLAGNILGADAEPLANTNGDNNNLMRYDPIAQQYILNWDINGADIANGTYRLYIDLGEGTCSEAHSVDVSIQKVGRGIRR